MNTRHTATVAAHAPQPGAAPKPRAERSTRYARAVDVVRRRGRVQLIDLSRDLRISEFEARRYIERMWRDGYLSSIDMFGACTCREDMRHV
jgi:predicted ArsR family transcriptional regulator